MRRGGYGPATSWTTHANRAVRLSVSTKKPREGTSRGFSVRCVRCANSSAISRGREILPGLGNQAQEAYTHLGAGERRSPGGRHPGRGFSRILERCCLVRKPGSKTTRRGGTKKKPREVSYRGLGSKLMRVRIGCPNRGESVAARAERFG